MNICKNTSLIWLYIPLLSLSLSLSISRSLSLSLLRSLSFSLGSHRIYISTRSRRRWLASELADESAIFGARRKHISARLWSVCPFFLLFFLSPLVSRGATLLSPLLFYSSYFLSSSSRCIAIDEPEIFASKRTDKRLCLIHIQKTSRLIFRGGVTIPYYNTITLQVRLVVLLLNYKRRFYVFFFSFFFSLFFSSFIFVILIIQFRGQQITSRVSVSHSLCVQRRRDLKTVCYVWLFLLFFRIESIFFYFNVIMFLSMSSRKKSVSHLRCHIR